MHVFLFFKYNEVIAINVAFKFSILACMISLFNFVNLSITFN